MEIEIKVKDDICLVTLRGDLNIYSAPAVVENLVSSFQKYHKVAVDLGGIGEMDTAGLQTLIAAKKEAIKTGKLLKIVNHSSVVIKLVDLLGLVGFFGDKIKIPVEERSNYSFKYGIKKQKVLSSSSAGEL